MSSSARTRATSATFATDAMLSSLSVSGPRYALNGLLNAQARNAPKARPSIFTSMRPEWLQVSLNADEWLHAEAGSRLRRWSGRRSHNGTPCRCELPGCAGRERPRLTGSNSSCMVQPGVVWPPTIVDGNEGDCAGTHRHQRHQRHKGALEKKQNCWPTLSCPA